MLELDGRLNEIHRARSLASSMPLTHKLSRRSSELPAAVPGGVGPDGGGGSAADMTRTPSRALRTGSSLLKSPSMMHRREDRKVG